MNTDFENADGGVINYEVANGLQNIGSDYYENGLSNEGLSFAEGNDNAVTDDDFFGADGDEDFYSADGDDDFYNARGGMFKNFRKNQKKRQDRRDLRTKSKAELRSAKGQAKITKADAKLGQADAQKESAKALGKGTEGDIAIANALANKGEAKTGMSTGAKVGIALGIVAILGVVGFIIYKKMKKGK